MSNPFLDVSDILLDPDIAGTFDVCRRVQVIGVNGRAKARPQMKLSPTWNSFSTSLVRRLSTMNRITWSSASIITS